MTRVSFTGTHWHRVFGALRETKCRRVGYRERVVQRASSTAGTARDCCAGHCANLQNDPLNCGTCGKKCDPGTYCGGGQCVTPPCQATCGGAAQCCGTTCCATGEICCDTQGPVATGPACTAPVNGTCPMGCAPLCKCAAPDTPIATPDGNKPIASLPQAGGRGGLNSAPQAAVSQQTNGRSWHLFWMQAPHSQSPSAVHAPRVQ
jgi:hypothetical protein